MKNGLFAKFTLDFYHVIQTVLNWTATEAKNCVQKVPSYSKKPTRVNLPYCLVLPLSWRSLGPKWCGSFRRIPKVMQYCLHGTTVGDAEYLSSQPSCLRPSPTVRVDSLQCWAHTLFPNTQQHCLCAPFEENFFVACKSWETSICLFFFFPCFLNEE